ncbi:MAG: MATE family efflux transporter [Candidatus Treponema excrementipullorum]|uniref:Multidrug-efflux transporter n=1 Tax=Candidatus Treponema excrementipullorum TaxID=2838768 RepID=A0A9E2L024_9SPIR|nr:MATE family efflux transporter [Candidatus Treponema excrementipullorum]
MKKNDSFFKTVCSLAVPVTLQSMLQSSFSIVDQIMIGQLGSVSVAGVGLAGKFASIYSVVISAIGAVAGIMIAQYLGQKNKYQVRRSFYTNLILGAVIAGLFMFFCVLFPERIMGLYTKDAATREEAGKYLAIVAGTFLPLAGATLLSTLFRCIEKARLPLYASIASALLNTGLNYVLIFGKLGFSPMGARGAAIATLISQCANLVLMLLMLPKKNSVLKKPEQEETENAALNWKQYLSMLLPILACEVLWSLGENVYAGIYGHMGTKAAAAMTLINPIQGLVIGALCGLSQAAGVIVGKKLGTGDYSDAYKASKKLVIYGAAGSIFLSVIVVLTAGFYVQIYQVEEVVKQLTIRILYAYALVAPFKVLNMILGGGIIRSGGRTKYVMYIDIIGTWIFGVPLGFLAAFVLKLPIPYVYFILSLEECIRFAISVGVFRKKKWLQQLEA